ncbi:hypothetical protein NKH77_40015 [Streptomyces sp. M19]
MEITHSGAYQEQLDFDLEPGDRFELRAAEGTRPVIRLLDWYGNRPDALNIAARGDACPPGEEPRIVLDGLLVAGRGLHVSGPVGRWCCATARWCRAGRWSRGASRTRRRSRAWCWSAPPRVCGWSAACWGRSR